MTFMRTGSLVVIRSLLLGACVTAPGGPSVSAQRASGLATAEGAGTGTPIGAGLSAPRR